MRFTCKVLTVDPSQRKVQVLFKGDARTLEVYSTPPAFRWPMVGENWAVEQKNGAWYLSEISQNSVPATLSDFSPGDAVINAATGIVHVTGSSDGSTDFVLRKPPFGRTAFTANVLTNNTTAYAIYNGTTVTEGGMTASGVGLTVPVDGIYLVTVNVRGDHTTGYRQIAVLDEVTLDTDVGPANSQLTIMDRLTAGTLIRPTFYSSAATTWFGTATWPNSLKAVYLSS
jgi:hypothetical protein